MVLYSFWLVLLGLVYCVILGLIYSVIGVNHPSRGVSWFLAYEHGREMGFFATEHSAAKWLFSVGLVVLKNTSV